MWVGIIKLRSRNTHSVKGDKERSNLNRVDSTLCVPWTEVSMKFATLNGFLVCRRPVLHASLMFKHRYLLHSVDCKSSCQQVPSGVQTKEIMICSGTGGEMPGQLLIGNASVFLVALTKNDLRSDFRTLPVRKIPNDSVFRTKINFSLFDVIWLSW